MPAVTLEEMVKAARAVVPAIAPEEAKKLLESGQALALDVRDAAEIPASGKIKGALNVPRCGLEFKADPASPRYDAALDKTKTILVYCNSGARALLAAKTLKDMGFADVRCLGGFQEWIASEGPVER